MSKMESADVYGMFETIRKDVKELKEQQPESIEIDAVNELAENMRTVFSEMRKPMTVEKRFTIGFASSRIFFLTSAIAISLILACIKISNQKDMIKTYLDNDLKYRYVKMHGGITPEGIYDLEQVFRNRKDSVKMIRGQVEQYERLVQEQAEKIEQARLNGERARQLQQQAESVKGNK